MGEKELLPAFQRVERELARSMQSIADAMTSGRAKNHEEYKFMVGKLQGMAVARDTLVESLKKELNDE